MTDDTKVTELFMETLDLVHLVITVKYKTSAIRDAERVRCFTHPEKDLKFEVKQGWNLSAYTDIK